MSVGREFLLSLYDPIFYILSILTVWWITNRYNQCDVTFPRDPYTPVSPIWDPDYHYCLFPDSSV